MVDASAVVDTKSDLVVVDSTVVTTGLTAVGLVSDARRVVVSSAVFVLYVVSTVVVAGVSDSGVSRVELIHTTGVVTVGLRETIVDLVAEAVRVGVDIPVVMVDVSADVVTRLDLVVLDSTVVTAGLAAVGVVSDDRKVVVSSFVFVLYVVSTDVVAMLVSVVMVSDSGVVAAGLKEAMVDSVA
jgi:hypothetical protein